MLQFAALAILFAAVCAVPINDEANSADLDVVAVDSIEEYLAENPNVQLLAPFAKEKIQDHKGHVYSRYKVGYNLKGERFIGHFPYTVRYPKPQNVTVTFHYPTSGAGSVVTYVDIVVLKNTDLDREGRAYVTAGGIGHRHITIAIEAPETSYLHYVATVDGYD